MHWQLLFWAETTLENTKIQVRNRTNTRPPNWEHILAEILGLSYLKETQILLIKAGISPSDPAWHICAYYHTFVQDPQVSLWEREKKNRAEFCIKNWTHSGSVGITSAGINWNQSPYVNNDALKEESPCVRQEVIVWLKWGIPWLQINSREWTEQQLKVWLKKVGEKRCF